MSNGYKAGRAPKRGTRDRRSAGNDLGQMKRRSSRSRAAIIAGFWLLAAPASAEGVAEAWQGTQWGESSAALAAHFGSRATVLPRPIDFGDSYADVVLRDVTARAEADPVRTAAPRRQSLGVSRRSGRRRGGLRAGRFDVRRRTASGERLSDGGRTDLAAQWKRAPHDLPQHDDRSFRRLSEWGSDLRSVRADRATVAAHQPAGRGSRLLSRNTVAQPCRPALTGLPPAP